MTEKQIFSFPFILNNASTDEKEPQKLTGKFVYSTAKLFLLYLYSRKTIIYFRSRKGTAIYGNDKDQSCKKQLEATDLFLVAKKNELINLLIKKYSRNELFEKQEYILTNPLSAKKDI